MRQHGRARHIANCVDALNIGATVSVDRHTAAIRLHAKGFKSKVFDIALHTDGGNQLFGRNLLHLAVLGLDMGGDPVLGLLDLGNLRLKLELDALFLELALCEFGDFRILDRQDLRHQLYNRHIRSHGAVEGGELHADGAGAHHDERFWHGLGNHRLEIGPDLIAIRLDARQNARTRTRRDNDVLCLVGACTLGVLRHGRLRLHRLFGGLGNDHLARLGKLRLAPDHVDLVLLHQEADAAIQPLGDLA